MPACVLFSGGQDSTTCLYWALKNFDRVEAIGFRYGQRHDVELVQADLIARRANVPFHIVDLKGLLTGSSLLDPNRPLDGAHPLAPNQPATFVPGRNLLFLAVAAAHAVQKGIHDLVTGVCETDYSGYPDCRRAFVDSLETTLSLAMEPHRFTIHTPLMHLDKADTFKLADEMGILDIILEDTHTDYGGDRTRRNEWGYGTLDNDASRLRARGWEEFKRRYRDRQNLSE